MILNYLIHLISLSFHLNMCDVVSIPHEFLKALLPLSRTNKERIEEAMRLRAVDLSGIDMKSDHVED